MSFDSHFIIADTWGSGIINQNTNTNHTSPIRFTFPYLISGNKAHNLAMRASGPLYPAICLQSMLHTSTSTTTISTVSTTFPINNLPPTVITLEFMLRASEGLDQLAHRLRTTYPTAIIIFLDIWYPRMVRVKYTHIQGKESINLQAYQHTMGYPSLQDPNFRHHLTTDTTLDLYLQPRADLTALQDKIAASVHGYIWTLTYPKNNHTIGPHVADMAHDWSDDYKHLSSAGHERVARGLQRLLRTIPAFRATPPTAEHVLSHDNHSSVSDHCVNWLLTGQSPHTILYGMEMTMFDATAGKYGLEVASTGGALEIVNPYSQPAILYWTFMVTGDHKYPPVQVTTGSHSTTIMILPTIAQPVHISQTTKLGFVPSGKSTIHFFPQTVSEWPFRLVASSLSQVDIVGDIQGFNAQAQAEQEVSGVEMMSR